MTPGETEAFATRISAEEAARIQEALDQTDLCRSDLLALGFRYYMAENPDNIPAFRPSETTLGPLQELGILPKPSKQSRRGIDGR
jgi:hypothetical protein